jgi:hypothetical protein
MNPNVVRYTVAALLVSCVGVVQAAIAAPPADSCALLTQAQATAALGVPVGAGKSLASKVVNGSSPETPARNC